MNKTIFFGSVFLLSLSLISGANFKAKELELQTQIRQIAGSIDDLNVAWAFDGGPSPDTKMGKELIDLVATQPFMPGISKEITGEQKFRPAFGPTLWRMIQTPNSVKILFIGQDGTHIAEAAGRTATAGFGGRAQDLAAYFGVRTGAAFMNTFAFTIRGQYSAFQTPIVFEDNGTKKIGVSTIADNGIWMMAQDQSSPMVKWRNKLIDWIIRNNKESLKLVVLFGGSAQDSIGTFIEAHGGKVGARYSEADIVSKKIKVPGFSLKPAGSNKVFAVVLDKEGKDLYAKIAGRRLDYSKPEDQQAALQGLSKNIDKYFSELALSDSGVGGSGIVHPAQINGFDLNKIQVNGQKTMSLRGLSLSDGSEIKSDILIAEFPHPTSLSLMTPDAASAAIAKSLKLLEPYVHAGWKIDPDEDMTNQFANGQNYRYGRTDIGPAYYDFGTPKNRMVSVSSASRMTGKPNVIVIGTRDKATFDLKAIDKAAKAKQPAGISPDEMFTARPRLEESRYVFDRGPGKEMAMIMKENLKMDIISKPKAGVDPKKSGIAAYNIKSDPKDVGDFGHYRGTFNNPKVVILADPDGYDDILTSRALTGARGQYLQSLMNAMGVNDQYLVIKTVPFGMDGATDEEWKTVLGQTSEYRKQIFKALFENGQPQMIMADGKFAEKEIEALVKLFKQDSVPTVFVERIGSDNDSGIKAAAAVISKIAGFKEVSYNGEMANIPKSHLGFFARVWEGTSGTHVFNSTSATDMGTAFAIVAPEWAFKQATKQSVEERKSIESIKSILKNENIKIIQTNSEDDTLLSPRYLPNELQTEMGTEGSAA